MEYRSMKIYEVFIVAFMLIWATRVSRAVTNPDDGKASFSFCFYGISCLFAKKLRGSQWRVCSVYSRASVYICCPGMILLSELISDFCFIDHKKGNIRNLLSILLSIFFFLKIERLTSLENLVATILFVYLSCFYLLHLSTLYAEDINMFIILTTCIGCDYISCCN